MVGTYDSYNTAIPARSLNDSWLTAQLPDPNTKRHAQLS
ncbi:glycoside hydrolase [Vibrio chagasii]|nr:glycoside hydrolase [Vibrio chagasii]